MKILIASNNQHKIREYKEILKDFDITLVSLKEMNIESDPEEVGLTFQENSFLKAKHAAKYCDLPILADDSGLIIEELPNVLGVHTSRFMGEETPYDKKRAAILSMLENKKNRHACFVCNITLYHFKNQVVSFQGECHGHIAFQSKGNEGFAFDPIFIPNGYEKTFAELGDEVKNTLSHRKKASDQLVDYLNRHFFD